MDARPTETPFARDPHADLEAAFEDEFLRSRGYDRHQLAELPASTANALLKEASTYASARLAECESRAHYVQEMHVAPAPRGRGPKPG